MAGRAIGAKLTVVTIVREMAGDTILCSAMINSSRVAAFAGNVHMLPVQCKTCQAVIEREGFPIIACMAGGAIRAKAARVRVILLVAGKTILRRGLQTCECMRVQVAGRASRVSVLSCQGKRGQLMVEV